MANKTSPNFGERLVLLYNYLFQRGILVSRFNKFGLDLIRLKCSVSNEIMDGNNIHIYIYNYLLHIIWAVLQLYFKLLKQMERCIHINVIIVGYRLFFEHFEKLYPFF